MSWSCGPSASRRPGPSSPRPSGPSAPAGTASRSPTRRTSSATRSSPSRSPPRPPSGSGSRPASPTRTPAIPPRWRTSRRPCRRRRAAASCSASAGATPRCSTSGCKPMKVDDVRRARSPTCRPTSANGTVDCDGRPSRLQWLDRARQPKVPLDVAASGPADDRVRRPRSPSGSRSRSAPTRTASPGRSTSPARPRPTPGATRPTISFGAYVNVGCHPDRRRGPRR